MDCCRQAKKAVKTLRSDKLKAQSVENIIAKVRNG